jgi:hypothetical protein
MKRPLSTIIHEPFYDDDTYYADKSYVSNSMLGKLMENVHLFARWLQDRHQYDDNPNYTVGRLYHNSLLEPHKVSNFHVCPVDRRDKRGKKWSEAVAKYGFDWTVTQRELKMVQNMKAKFFQQDVLTTYLEYGDKEVPGTAEIFGVPVKGKADIIYEDIDGKRIGLDPKSTSAPVSSFKKSAYLYDYDRQAAMYMRIFDLDEFYFIPQEKNYPYTPALIKASDEFIASGERKLQKALTFYRELFIEGGYNPKYLYQSTV